jgi:hypothetical protein
LKNLGAVAAKPRGDVAVLAAAAAAAAVQAKRGRRHFREVFTPLHCIKYKTPFFVTNV